MYPSHIWSTFPSFVLCESFVFVVIYCRYKSVLAHTALNYRHFSPVPGPTNAHCKPQYFAAYELHMCSHLEDVINFNHIGEINQKLNVPEKNTGWSKSHATHSWHMFYLSKINYIEIRKQKTMLCQVLKMSTAFSNAYIHSFPHVWCNLTPNFDRNGFCPRFLCHENGSPDEILSICLAQKNWEMYP
jgi:hypothetical protein